MDYFASSEQPVTILPSTSEHIWEKFEYFDKMAQEYPNCEQYEFTRWRLLNIWLDQFQKELNVQRLIPKK